MGNDEGHLLYQLFLSEFQSTFPRGERHQAHLQGAEIIEISIHVPAWGTTAAAGTCSVSLRHFNPRSRVGNDGRSEKEVELREHFNPRSRVGNDCMKGLPVRNCLISIHVPAWGTTFSAFRQHLSRMYFNPRSRVGNDDFKNSNSDTPNIFQSTFPRGERQSRSGLMENLKVFQSTFPRGERRIISGTRTDNVDFNPRSRVGNDGVVVSIFSFIEIFQSTFPRGERRNSGNRCQHRVAISIHVPAWGTTANFHKYSLFFYAINIIFLLFIIPSLFSLVLFMLLF